MKVFLLEDCLIIREMLRVRCAVLHGMDVVGESALVEETIALLPQCRPDIIVLDIGLTGSKEDGFTVAKFIRTDLPATKILVLSGYLSEYSLALCEMLQVDGYIDKTCAGGQIFDEALRAVTTGATYFTPTYLSARRAWLSDPRAIAKRLSSRETAVLCLAARGFTDAEIAQDLTVTPSTATTHRSNVLRKLGLPSSTKLMAHAVERGYGALR